LCLEPSEHFNNRGQAVAAKQYSMWDNAGLKEIDAHGPEAA